ncbi:helix-turn-helix transcriptional regulator [Streptomyces sp. NPDC020719]|uniref:helix-turn-helix domain-containing protein n=1 Tax=Streptomyces sp. NPDC020719 TaxID=3154896 RepID=UPI0033FA84F8
MTERASWSLADRINFLFSVTRDPNGRQYSNEQIAAAIRTTGVAISQSYIWQLRKNKKTNPTLRHLQALADFFRVPVSYFFDDCIADRLEPVISRFEATVTDSQIRLIVLRTEQLSEERRRQVLEFLDVISRLEQAERRGFLPEVATSQRQGS